MTGPFPTLNLTNQFGEQSANYVTGGSNQIDLNFIVDSANGNGLCIRSLKAGAGTKVFMHTSSTPAGGNPNPASGLIIVQLGKGHAGYVGGYSGFVSPVSGTPINVSSGLTLGAAYVIVSVGTTTQSQWESLGLQAGLVPTVGQSFTAITASAGSGTGVVEAPAATGAGVYQIDVIGDPNQSSAPTDGSGSWFLLRCLAGSTPGATAPADGTVIGLRFVMDGVVQEP